MQRSEDIKEIVKALNILQAQLKPALFDSKNPHFKSPYASFKSVMDAVRGTLAINGLSFIQGVVETTTGKLYLETVLFHVSGQWLSAIIPIFIDKFTSQGAGSALTYSKRYGLSCLLGIVADTDDDGESTEGRGGSSGYSDSHVSQHKISSGSSDSSGWITVKSNPISDIVNSVEWVVPFGKYKGLKISDINLDELRNYISFIEQKSEAEGKQLTGGVKEFCERGSKIIANFENSSMDDSTMFQEDPRMAK